MHVLITDILLRSGLCSSSIELLVKLFLCEQHSQMQTQIHPGDS